MRKAVTLLLTFLAGAFFILEFLIPETLAIGPYGRVPNPLTPHLGLATDLIIVIGTMAFLLGPINLVRSHAATLFRGRTGWLPSLVFLVFLVGSVAVTMGKDLAAPGGPWAAGLGRAYDVLFWGLNFGFGTTSMALLTFYLVSAAYRSFRLNSLDSGVMFVSATIVLLGRTPIGDWLTSGLPAMLDFLRVSALENWIMTIPNSAVQRAVVFGTFAGAFAAALRFWLGLGMRRAE